MAFRGGETPSSETGSIGLPRPMSRVDGNDAARSGRPGVVAHGGGPGRGRRGESGANRPRNHAGQSIQSLFPTPLSRARGEGGVEKHLSRPTARERGWGVGKSRAEFLA